MRLALRLGIPHSQLSAWPVQDVDLALAAVALEADTGNYGELLSEATDPRADPNDYTPGGWRYVAHGPFTNWAEKAAKTAEAQWRKQAGDNPDMAGMFWTVEKV
ncbi:MAG TPA: hypothetical protein VFU07_07100 [Candidatus Lumbricidophila sp.]|nr:hypothetical protein [Candidatus Lumbricidophila sp.]